tara:strand:+ start:217 stop:459 length:243 start_codon:yes stop_codon:yes gene_type:complete
LVIKVFIGGVFVLVTAIVVNIIMPKLGILTWYEFGPNLLKNGWPYYLEVGLLNILWLFFLYPLVLGLSYHLSLKLYEIII